MHQARLKELSKTIVQDHLYPGEVLQAVNAFKQLMMETIHFDENVPEAQYDKLTHSGKAIAPKWAGMCVTDYQRTYTFCKALYLATQKIVQEKGHIHILYAGTGPFATLVLPLTQHFTSDQLQLTLLEIHEYSFEMLQNTIQEFGLEKYIVNAENCDATEYIIDNPESIDLLVTETMMHSLKDEHQVSITYHLLSQLKKEVVLIPHKIELELVAVNEDIRDTNRKSLEDPKPYSKKLGSLFTLDKETVFKNHDHFKKHFPEVSFDAVEIEIPDATHRAYHNLSIATTIEVYPGISLEIDNSGLTVLQKLMDLNSMLQTVSKLEATYSCGSKPGLHFKMIP